MSYCNNPSFADESLTLTMGFNNIFDEDPPVCFPCLPGRVGYIRVTYEQ